ncbi:MAG TPA: hypothetical protein PLW88_07470, partial [Syntrophorhabdaceae bacterium]|nr:hypothetical protein [Syntrophorhabdaceae bacterium]
ESVVIAVYLDNIAVTVYLYVCLHLASALYCLYQSSHCSRNALCCIWRFKLFSSYSWIMPKRAKIIRIVQKIIIIHIVFSNLSRFIFPPSCSYKLTYKKYAGDYNDQV